MSKYSDKKKRQAEEAARAAKVDAVVDKKVASVVANFKKRKAADRDEKLERDRQWKLSIERRAAKYNKERSAAARGARRNSPASNLTNAELIVLSREIEKKVKPKYADVIAALRSRLVIELAMTGEISAAVAGTILEASNNTKE